VTDVAVVCFGFESAVLRKQPWRYVHEVSKCHDGQFDLTVVTDGTREDVGATPVRSVDALHTATGPSDQLLEAIADLDPEVVVTVVGPTTFLRPRTLATELDRPVVGLVTATMFGVREVARVGARELVTHPDHLKGHALGALIPDAIVRNRAEKFDRFVALTEASRRRLQRTDVDVPIDVLPPGIDEFDLQAPDDDAVRRVRRQMGPTDVPVVLYFTSPLSLRGTDVLVRAFARVADRQPCKLVFLSRQDGGGMAREERRILDIAESKGVADSVELIPRNLTPTGVKTHVAAADVVALPFKIVVSSVPISVLEAMAMGRPLVTTDVGGLPEIVDDASQIVPPNDVDELAGVLGRYVGDDRRRTEVGRRNRTRMEEYPRWDDARARFETVLEDTFG